MVTQLTSFAPARFGFAIFLYLAIWTESSRGALSTETPNIPERNSIFLTISLIWEGDRLDRDDLKAVEEFRQQFPNASIVHFLNPSYWNKPGAVAADIRSRILRTMRPGDLVGLHTHGWKSSVEGAGVQFRSNPTFWGLKDVACMDDCGHDVSLDAYSESELRALISFEIDTLEKNGFKRPVDFMAGGWISSRKVLSALAREGFKRDYSAIPPSTVFPRSNRFPLFKLVNELWHNVLPYTQPYTIKTPGGRIQQMTNNAGTMDYQSVEGVTDLFDAYLKLARGATKPQPLHFHIGAYQESAAKHLPRLSTVLEKILARASASGVTVVYNGDVDASAFGPETEPQVAQLPN